MVTETKVNIAGVWKELLLPEVNVGGVWKECVSIESNVGGVWKEVWLPPAAATVTVSGESIVDQGAGARLYRATLRVTNDGNMHKFVNMTVTQIDTANDWVRPTSAASIDYEVKYDYVSGDTLHASTSLSDGQWGTLAASKFFESRHEIADGIGVHTTTITISIRFQGGSVLDSANYTLRASRLF